ncbi:MAG: hypothetical protein LC128_05200 [Chitinophagales bacterium]|nr:hypothetical protein [Chitinophagales bacterium]
MNPGINLLTNSFLHRNSLSECSTDELHELAEKYPYSSAFQLLLAARLKTEDPKQFKEQYQKAALHFTNPLWLDYLLRSDEPVITEGISEKENIVSEVIPVKEAEEKNPVIKIASPPETKTPEQSNDLLFEPYHTVDYFASQGVKYKSEEKPSDRFGQQLKSFTEWLKVLKRAPETEISKTADPAGEGKVEQLAAHSIEDRNVVTEAMAEVWEKQGNTEKAMEIYNKLGLLNPAKSSYFAAKIEKLKNRN